MTKQQEWREAEVKRVGPKVQNDAEAILDKQASEPFVERNDEKGGRKGRYRRNIADILELRGDLTRPKIYSTSPNSEEYKRRYDLIDWGQKG